MSPAPHVLALNCGSSSVKFAVFAGDDERRVAEGAVTGIGDHEGMATGRAWVRFGDRRLDRTTTCQEHGAALAVVFGLLDDGPLPAVDAVGHRVVHGGPRHVGPARIDGALLQSLEALTPLAPLHLPAALSGMRAASKRYPNLPQVACFDTAFHATLPERARRLPLPPRLVDERVRRYGFHGLSYEYVVSRLEPMLPSKVVIAHLGSGSSLVAVEDGRSIDTTMGFTPTGGILMGTRSGDLDPGVLVYLAREHGLGIDEIERIVDRESGLAAIGGTPDMEALLARSPADPRARLAIEMFAYAIRKAVGGFVAALGGIDLLVFTGGIGENAPEIRARACDGLESLGLVIDTASNANVAPRGDATIGRPEGRAQIRVIAADEERMIARHARALMGGRRSRTDPSNRNSENLSEFRSS